MSLPYFILLLSIICIAHSKEHGLGISPRFLRNAPDTKRQEVELSSTDSDPIIFNYSQNLDHFTFRPESYTKFQQRYAVVLKHWAGAKANAPIFAYLGEESSLETDLSIIGFLTENGPRFKALLVYIEHRFYGKSMPFGSGKEALKNASTLGYLNSAQALADYASILLHIKDKYSAKHSPIIVVGGSYGGMLAAWFRLKYPHIAVGALASSAPILYFEDTRPENGYYYIISKVFKETSENCHNKIRESWDEIDRIAAKPNGLSILRQKFRICNSLNDAFELKDYLDTIYALAAQYNTRSYPVTAICNAINTIPPNTKIDLLGQIFAGVVAFAGNYSCYDTSIQPTNNGMAWSWQCCTEIVMPIGHDKQDTMFQTVPFDMSRTIKNCESNYGVPPRPHWLTAYFGIQDVKLILRRFGSNIIFSNGLLDPYSVGSVLENISDTVVAITTRGSHCQDIILKSKEDPEWLVMQREREIKVIDSWIEAYKRDLKYFNISV